MSADSGQDGDPAERIFRHQLVDRCHHWLMASSVLVLLGTGLLPVLGIKFEWLLIHWCTGLLLTALTAFHILRSLIWKDPREMWLRFRELSEQLQLIRSEMSGMPYRVQMGKYSVPHKMYHLASSLVLLAVIISGLVMLLKIDTPWWQRDPYLMSQQNWGYLYVLHGFTSLCLITMIMIHVYFALRPEKWGYTRSMFLGWMTGTEYQMHLNADQDVTQENL